MLTRDQRLPSMDEQNLAPDNLFIHQIFDECKRAVLTWRILFIQALRTIPRRMRYLVWLGKYLPNTYVTFRIVQLCKINTSAND